MEEITDMRSDHGKGARLLELRRLYKEYFLLRSELAELRALEAEERAAQIEVARVFKESCKQLKK